MPPSTPDPTAADVHRPPTEADALRQGSETHRVIEGRRWRVSDPVLDESTRQQLVNELMDARRAVKAALAAADSADEATARNRVDDAKVALGERGPKWWEPCGSDDVDLRVRAFIRAIGTRLGEIDERRARALIRGTD